MVRGFDELDGLPHGFCEIEACEIKKLFPQPTLVHLAGERTEPLFVSILLHGNEDAGLLAFQEFLRRFRGRAFPRTIRLFVGNVEACELGVRFRGDQVDFNRSWPGSDLPAEETQEMLRAVHQRATDAPLFASLDVHNNTGRNPLYACICSLAPEHLRLASLFSPRIIYFIRPHGVQTQAFMAHCPSATLECGKIGDLAGAHAAADLIQRCSELDALPSEQVEESQIFHTVARIDVHAGCKVGFEPQDDVVLREDLELLNFTRLRPGETLGKLNRSLEDCFGVYDEHGADVTGQYLATVAGGVVFQRPVTPAMFTQNLEVMRQDCLGYLLDPINPRTTG